MGGNGSGMEENGIKIEYLSLIPGRSIRDIMHHIERKTWMWGAVPIRRRLWPVFKRKRTARGTWGLKRPQSKLQSEEGACEVSACKLEITP